MNNDIKLLKEARAALNEQRTALDTEKTARVSAEKRAEGAETKVAAYEAAIQLVQDRVIGAEEVRDYVTRFLADPSAIKAAQALVDMGATFTGSLGRTVSAPDASAPGSAHDVLDQELRKLAFTHEAFQE